MWGRRSLRAPLAEPLTSRQRRLREPKMATAPCSTDVFEHLDDAAREEAYRSAVSEAAALKTEVDQLRRELELLKMVPSKDHDAANDDDAPKPPLDPQLQASHDFLCNLLAPLIERIERLESRTREDSDAASCTSAGESYASINMKRGSINQQSQAKGTNTRCMSNDEDARDRLSSFAASSLPHLGKDLNAWFHQVDYWFRTFSVPDEVAVPFIISRLPAKDFTWMRHHTKVADISTWADMKAAFRRRYNMDCDVTSKQRMFGATQRAGESCTDFAYRKLDLMEQCNYPVLQQEKCQIIMDTLSPKAKKHFFDKTFRHLNDMISSFLRFDQIRDSEQSVQIVVAEERESLSTAQSVECRVDSKRSPRKPRRHRQRTESIGSSESSDDQVAQRNVPKRGDTKRKPSQSRPSTHSTTRVFERSQGNASRIRKLCLNCSKSGHFVTQCPLPLTHEFLKWQEEFESSSSQQRGNAQLVTPTPASSRQ